MIKYIADKEYYTEVLSRCGSVKHDLDRMWNGAYCPRCKRKDFCGDRISK